MAGAIIMWFGCGRIAFDPTGEPGLLLWYPLDDSFEGSAVDASGGGRPATCAIGTSCPVPAAGRRGGAAMFDGVSQRLRTPFNDGLSTPVAFTIAAWMNPQTYSSFNAVFAKPSSDTVNSNTWVLEMPSTQISQLRAWSVTAGNRQVDGLAVVLGVWTHLAGTWDGATLRIYVDGVETNQTAFTDLKLDIGDVLVGADLQATAETSFFHGRIDDVRLYDRALGADEITVLAR